MHEGIKIQKYQESSKIRIIIILRTIRGQGGQSVQLRVHNRGNIRGDRLNKMKCLSLPW